MTSLSDDLFGQNIANRAIQIALWGYHSLVLIGGAGTGKTSMLSKVASNFPETVTRLGRQFDASLLRWIGRRKYIYLVDDFHLFPMGRRLRVLELISNSPAPVVIAAIRTCQCGKQALGACFCNRMQKRYHFTKMNEIIGRSNMWVSLDEPRESIKPEPWVLGDHYTAAHNVAEISVSEDIESRLRAFVSTKELISRREVDNCIRVAKTISEIDGKEDIDVDCLLEAIGYVKSYSYDLT